jgi:hypothetical protein
MKGEYSFDFDKIGDPLLNRIIQFPPFINFGRAYFGIQTHDRNGFVSKEKLNADYQPVVDGTNVNRYFLKPHIEYVLFKNKAIKSGGNPAFYQKQRILVRQIGKFPDGCFCQPGIYTLNTIYNLFLHEESQMSPKFLLSLINSSTIKYYWIKTSTDSKETFPKIKKGPLESIPIVKIDLKKQQVFVLLADSIMELRRRIFEEKSNINSHVSNSHLVQVFEELLDSMVMELYFKEDFEKAGIEFIKYAERDFESIEGKSELEQIEMIHRAYQKLREKDNEIRNNLKLMDIKLADIVIPIKAAK